MKPVTGGSELDDFACEAIVKGAERAGRIMSWNSPLMAKMGAKIYAGYKKIDAHLARGEWGNTWLRCAERRSLKSAWLRDIPPAICAQDHRMAGPCTAFW